MFAKYQYSGATPDTRTEIIDDETALWCSRMCVGEGGLVCSDEKISSMLWALMNRAFLWRGRNNYPTYLKLMRAFSQPINPRWQRGGDLAIKWAGRPPASLSRLSRRAHICSMDWSDIPIHIKKAVCAFQVGELFIPDIWTTINKARISNWASLPSTPKKYPWGIDIDGDWFFEDKGLRQGCVVVNIEG